MKRTAQSATFAAVTATFTVAAIASVPQVFSDEAGGRIKRSNICLE